MKPILNQLLKWGIFALTAFYITKTTVSHWHEVQGLALNPASGILITGAIACIILAEYIVGLLWHWLLDTLQQRVPLNWTVETVFKTTLAKYIPGSVWHLVGRVHASKAYDIPIELVSLSVLLEPLFMIAGGLVVALLCLHYPVTQLLSLLFVAGLLHPKGINFVFRVVQSVKREQSYPICLSRYPWREILGGSLYMTLKGVAFCLTLACFQPLNVLDLPQSISGFSLSWLLSLVIPAPGGIGVFEAAAMHVMASLSNPEILISSVLTFRLLSIVAEILGAGIVITTPMASKLLRFNYHSLRATVIPSAN